jgi:hypothetical protein
MKTDNRIVPGPGDGCMPRTIVYAIFVVMVVILGLLMFVDLSQAARNALGCTLLIMVLGGGIYAQYKELQYKNQHKNQYDKERNY